MGPEGYPKCRSGSWLPFWQENRLARFLLPRCNFHATAPACAFSSVSENPPWHDSCIDPGVAGIQQQLLR
jgi:hypothetical protein